MDKLSRRDFLKVGGVTAVSLLAAGCVPSMEEAVQETIQHPEKQPEAPQWLKDREVSIDANRIDKETTYAGSGVILYENEKEIRFLSIDHVFYHGYYLGNIDITGSSNFNRSRGPEDYTIYNDPQWEENNNPLVIISTPKKPGEHFINNSSVPDVQIFQGELAKGQTLLCCSYPVDTSDPKGRYIGRGKLFDKNQQYVGMVNDYTDDAGHNYPPLMKIDGLASYGSSGAGVFTEQGEIAGIVVGQYGNPQNKQFVAMPVKNWIYHISCDPRLYNPESHLNLCLHPPHVL